ncbi:orf119b (mitochondrion) [Beta vulgaris subsp. vulgaris]|uniref:Orf119b protein n=3 Tax=Beta TaxID=3554 RepID=Q9MFA6_BETVV|nr:orf119b [Beta vulgaris subsp. vulgaris]YP_004222276.1 hypothetical protein LKY74_mgp127 [Beta vulgaris subsp. maritima]YP_004842083.1 hypothetical protein LKY79_mgp125 [Beta macrocarpa]CBJ14099.1 hypothetical protein [Beta vulgaris subsp. maritima]CBJ17508.1 hypothetical protein [Beta vulgaris subsp. maritima]CBJ23361.1 hypothetical protein [Beta vulgaris subsp. maritima]CBL52047.1 hypothetical protein [Beta vulgaris subsp. maritima]CBX24885.1 hypothetical protein [Beta macrocarpa]
MNKSILFKAISSVESLDVFNIRKGMENLSLYDKTTSSSSASSASSSSLVKTSLSTPSNSTTLHTFMNSGKHSSFTRLIMDKTRAPFIDIPRNIMDISSKSKDFILSLGFRFKPGQLSAS